MPWLGHVCARILREVALGSRPAFPEGNSPSTELGVSRLFTAAWGSVQESPTPGGASAGWGLLCPPSWACRRLSSLGLLLCAILVSPWAPALVSQATSQTVSVPSKGPLGTLSPV